MHNFWIGGGKVVLSTIRGVDIRRPDGVRLGTVAYFLDRGGRPWPGRSVRAVPSAFAVLRTVSMDIMKQLVVKRGQT